MALHELKSWPPYFQLAANGDKSGDLRTDDRNFQVGDQVLLREFIPAPFPGKYTGRYCLLRITWVGRGEEVGRFGLMEGFCLICFPGGGAPIKYERDQLDTIAKEDDDE